MMIRRGGEAVIGQQHFHRRGPMTKVIDIVEHLTKNQVQGQAAEQKPQQQPRGEKRAQRLSFPQAFPRQGHAQRQQQPAHRQQQAQAARHKQRHPQGAEAHRQRKLHRQAEAAHPEAQPAIAGQNQGQQTQALKQLLSHRSYPPAPAWQTPSHAPAANNGAPPRAGPVPPR